MKTKLFFPASVVLLIFLASCGGTEPKVLPEPAIFVNGGSITDVFFNDLTVVSVEPPPANLGNAEVWLNEGEVAEISFVFGETDSQVVVTPDPVYKEGLTLGFLDEATLGYTPADVISDLTYVYARLEPGVVRVYVAAKGFEATHFWVRLDEISQ